MDTLLLSRIQFAANISFHILFPTITIALGWVLLFFKLRFNRTGERKWMDLYLFWVKVFALSFALKTYFQKIADPQDIAPTAAVAFTINHIAAVFLPAALGYMWAKSPDWVFLLGAGMALVALALALMIPRHPEPGYETVFGSAGPRAAPAE